MQANYCVLLLAGLCLSSCATAIKGSTEAIQVTSEPVGASVVFQDITRKQSDRSCTTPCNIELARTSYNATVSLSGYAPFTYRIRPTTTLGRSLLTAGGSYGAVLDSRDGADRVLRPDVVSVKFAPAGGRSTATDDDGNVLRTLDYGTP